MSAQVKGASQFWDAQHDIRVLSIPQSSTFPCNDPAQLPNLEALECTTYVLPFAPRPLKHLQLHIDTDIHALGSLRFHAQTLTTLSLALHGSTISTLDFIKAVAESVPDLVHFNIIELGPGVSESSRTSYLLIKNCLALPG